MSVQSDITEGLHALVSMWSKDGTSGAFSAEVISVDLDARSCSVRSISSAVEMEYPTVWLMPEIADGILYKPKVGSTVIVENNSNMQPYVSMWSEIDGVYYVVNRTTLSMTDGLTKFNKGNYGGVPIVGVLTAKINALESVVNNLLTQVTAVPILGTLADAAAVKAGLLLGLGDGIPAPTTREELEDTAVTH